MYKFVRILFNANSEVFYVRNHLPVPDVDPIAYELDIEGLGIKEKTLSLEDIKKFPKHTITAAIQCGGNRRSEMAKVRNSYINYKSFVKENYLRFYLQNIHLA